jgi:hypothetical protein
MGSRIGMTAAGLLLFACLFWIGASAWSDLRGRATNPEATVRTYFAALERGDADAALAMLPETSREQWRPFVENSLLNEYRIAGIAVRTTSLLDRMRGAPPGAQDVTVFLEITQYVDGVRWQAGPRVPLVPAGARWLLAYPPLSDT